MTTKLCAEIIGFDSGWGCKDYGCEDGPTALSNQIILHDLSQLNVEAKWHNSLKLKNLGSHDDYNTKEKALPLLQTCLSRLHKAVKSSVENQHIPIVIGGDHSSAIGTWAGVVDAKKAHNNFGLIWLDAHLDAHTNTTSTEGKWGGWWHGQPVTALLGHGLPALTSIGGNNSKISPEHLSMIGIRSFEPAEKAFVEEQGIRVYYIDEVNDRGFKDVFSESLTRATNGTSGFGLSIDLDGFRPEDAPGVGTCEKGGLIASDVLTTLRGLAYNSGFSALEIAEFNPHKDENDKTKRLIKDIIKYIFTKD